MELPQDFKPKSFWERKEGTTGMIVAVLIGLAGILMLDKILPWIINLLQNTLTAAVLFAAVAAIVYVASDRRFRTLLSYLYKSGMRALTGLFVTIDPIGILKNYIADLREQMRNMETQIGRLKGEIRKLADVITQNERERVASLKMVQQAKEAGKQSVMVLKSRKAGRLSDSNVTLQQLHNRLETLYRVLMKMHEAAGIMLEDLSDEVDIKEREYNAIRASYSAYRAAFSVIKGDADKKALFDQTMEYLTEDYGNKLGEMENFMDMSRGFLDSLDLQNGVYEADALAALEKWEQDSDSFLLKPGEKQMLIGQAQDPHQQVNLEESDTPMVRTRGHASGTDFDRFFPGN